MKSWSSTRWLLLPLLLALAASAAAQPSARRQAELDGVRLVRSAYAAWAAADWEALLALLEEDVRWTESRTLPFGGAARGRQQVLERVLLPLERDLEGVTIALDHLLASGSQVVATGTLSAFHRGTGRPIWSPYVGVWVLREGRVRSYSGFVDSDRFRHAYGR